MGLYFGLFAFVHAWISNLKLVKEISGHTCCVFWCLYHKCASVLCLWISCETILRLHMMTWSFRGRKICESILQKPRDPAVPAHPTTNPIFLMRFRSLDKWKFRAVHMLCAQVAACMPHAKTLEVARRPKILIIWSKRMTYLNPL